MLITNHFIKLRMIYRRSTGFGRPFAWLTMCIQVFAVSSDFQKKTSPDDPFGRSGNWQTLCFVELCQVNLLRSSISALLVHLHPGAPFKQRTSHDPFSCHYSIPASLENQARKRPIQAHIARGLAPRMLGCRAGAQEEVCGQSDDLVDVWPAS